MKNTPEYKSYSHAKSRCTNSNEDAFPHYGGRGIEFRFNSFEEFFSELGPKPEPKHKYSVDRIDNDGHYEPGNVRWTTRSQQIKNRRPVFGEKAPRAKLTEADVIEIRKRLHTQTHKELAREFGVVRSNIGMIARGHTWQHVEMGEN